MNGGQTTLHIKMFCGDTLYGNQPLGRGGDGVVRMRD
jgi:hypothetical protein